MTPDERSSRIEDQIQKQNEGIQGLLLPGPCLMRCMGCGRGTTGITIVRIDLRAARARQLFVIYESLRNRFPKIKEMVETEGEVIVTDKGEPKYKLTLYTPAQAGNKMRAKDYMSRLRPLSTPSYEQGGREIPGRR